MSSLARVHARALAVSATMLGAALLTGCSGTGSSSVTASGTTLAVYMSVPAGADAVQQDVLDAEQLAFRQQGSAPIGKFKLKLIRVTGAKLSDHARTAIQNTSAVAYLGELASGSSSATIGINNAQDLLQVSPTDTALELTQSTPAVSNTPDRYYESLKTYGHTFARVVPSSAAEAKAQIQEMRALGVTRLFVADDGSAYGKSVTQAVRSSAPPGITIAGSAAGADAMFYGGSGPAAAAHAMRTAQSATPALKLFGPSALNGPAFFSALGSSARNVYISTPGFLPKNLTPAAKTFVTDFKAAYGHAPAAQAAFGYEAMNAVIAVLRGAGASANNRATVVKDFFGIRNRSSVLGTYSINSNGDTSIAPFVFIRLEHGKPVQFVQVQG